MDKGSSGIGKKSFPQKLWELDFISEERSGYVDGLTSDNYYSLTYMSEFLPERSCLAT